MTVGDTYPLPQTTGTAPTRGQGEVDLPVALLDAMVALPPEHPDRPALRSRVIEAWMPLARRLAHRYHHAGHREDLEQTALVGLINAVDRFDPAYGSSFPSFAVPTIVGEIRRFFRDRTWDIRVPRGLQELRLAIARAEDVLSHRLGRSPTVADIAAELGVSEEHVLDGLEGRLAYNARSLSTPIGPDDGIELGETLGAPDSGFDLVDLHLSLGPALATLSSREQRIIGLRFYGNLTQSQIAEQVGVSQMHVSRLITRALGTLRRQLLPPTPSHHRSRAAHPANG